MKSGMKHLIEAFYRSITENTPGPIRYEEIILTARIMDQTSRSTKHAQLQHPMEQPSSVDDLVVPLKLLGSEFPELIFSSHQG